MIKVSFLIFLCLFLAINVTGQEREDSFFIIPFGYDFFRFGEQSIHSPIIGAGFLFGEQDIPFDEVERRFLALALYQPFFFREEPSEGLPKHFHQIDAIFDGRINRHQLLVIFKSAADKPVAGGLNTFQAGIGWGYEIVRRPNVSFIIGAALGVSDFEISGISSPILPLPLVRFGFNSQWVTASFDFLTGPNLDITIAPRERIRFTADMRLDNYRSINDLIFECILWYRLFDENHRLGDFAGIGIGVKNDSVDFVISSNDTTFELQQNSVFAVADLSLLKIEAGWIFNSRYLINETITESPGRGFFISIQGIIPIQR